MTEIDNTSQQCSIKCKIYKAGTLITSFDLASGVSEGVNNQRDAMLLVSSYVSGLVVQGGTATFDKTLREFRIAMPDERVKYVECPVLVLVALESDEAFEARLRAYLDNMDFKSAQALLRERESAITCPTSTRGRTR